MMIKRKIAILVLLLIAVAGFTVAPASAAKTGKLYFKNDWSGSVTYFNKNSSNKDYIHGEYLLN
ncbi:MAG: hypothetical protein ACRCVG_01475 [Methanobacteriaceae archaeon]